MFLFKYWNQTFFNCKFIYLIFLLDLFHTKQHYGSESCKQNLICPCFLIAIELKATCKKASATNKNVRDLSEMATQ